MCSITEDSWPTFLPYQQKSEHQTHLVFPVPKETLKVALRFADKLEVMDENP